MANRTLTADVIATEALAILDNELGWLKTIHRAYEDEWDDKVNGYKIGSTLSIRRPADFTVRTGPTMAVQDVIEGKVQIVINTQKGIDFQFTSQEMTLEMTGETGLSERVIKPAMINLINDIANDVAVDFYRNVYNWAGGSTIATLDSYADFIKGPERLNEMAVPMASRGAMLSPSDHAGLLGSQTALFIQGPALGAYRDAELGRLSGVDTYMSQVTPTHTAGTRTNTTPLVDGASQNVTYNTAKDTWTQSLIIKGAGNAVTYLEGDVFTIANVFMVNPKTRVSTGILQQFVVRANATSDSGGAITVTIAPPIIVSGPHQTVNAAPADGAAIVNRGTASTAYKQNLVYHKNSMALCVVPMELPAGAVSPARRSHKGLSVRVIPVYDGTNDNNKWRLDILYGKKCIDPRLATRLSGSG